MLQNHEKLLFCHDGREQTNDHFRVDVVRRSAHSALLSGPKSIPRRCPQILPILSGGFIRSYHSFFSRQRLRSLRSGDAVQPEELWIGRWRFVNSSL